MTSSLIRECEAAIGVPPEERSSAEHRLLISQGLDLENSVPRAIRTLTENPLIQAEYFHGDLLKAVLEIDQEFWTDRSKDWLSVHQVLDSIDQALAAISKSKDAFIGMSGGNTT